MTELTQELEKVARPSEARTVLDLIDRQRPELVKLLGSEAMAERLARTVLTELRRTPTLYECSPESLLGAMMLAAQLGLEPGPLGHVYLVPFKKQVEFIVGYKGYIDLAYRSGQVRDVAASLVHEGDEFAYREGTRPFLDHTPAGPADERPVTHGYAVARLKSGGTVFVVLFPEDFDRAKAKSASGSKGTGPWITDTKAMQRKTCVRRLAPFLPSSPALALALGGDQTEPEFDDVVTV